MDSNRNGDLMKVYLTKIEGDIPAIQIGNELLHLELQDISNEYLTLARNELRETREIKEKALIQLKELIANDPILNVPIDDERILVKFLRPCKFYPESAFELMKNLQKHIEKTPKIFKDLVPSKEYNVFSQDIIAFLPRRDKHGRRMLTIHSGYKWIPKKCSLNEIYKASMLAMQAAIYEPNTQVAGVIAILDMEGLTINHVWQFTPSFAKSVIHWVQECIPIRIKAIHIINQPYIFNMIFAIFKPLLEEKIRSRIHFHGQDREALINDVGADALPIYYGGTLDIPPIPGTCLWELMKSYEKEYEYFNSFWSRKS